MAAQHKQIFLDCVRESSAMLFLHFSYIHKSNQSDFCFEDLIKLFRDEELIQVWINILTLTESAAALILAVDELPARRSIEYATRVLQTAVDFGFITMRTLSCVPTGLLQVATFLHGLLLRFPEDMDSLQNSISLLCEKIWCGNICGKEHVIPNTMIYILQRSVRENATKSDIKRAEILKDAFVTIQASDDADLDELIDALTECIASSLYLSSLEGRKLITTMLGLDVNYVDTFHEAIKDKLSSCTVSQSKVFGKIYYDAWLESVSNNNLFLKEELELVCIQDLMYNAVNCQRICKNSMVPKLRALLSYFHAQKKEMHVLKMLVNLYQPIIWRGLKHLNGKVRANASQLFFDVFPLEDPEVNIADSESELHNQLLIIKDLLVDDYPVVRSIAAVGVSLLMNLNWELFSSEIIKLYLNTMVDLAYDASTVDVRCAALKGFCIVLKNHLALPVLKDILPRLRGVLLDTSGKVKLTFCNLLLDIRNIISIKYWDIVPLVNLINAMAREKSSVAKLIVKIIYNSYMPETETEDLWFPKCIELIKHDKKMSRVFFLHAQNFIGLKATVKFMIKACQSLHLYAKSSAQSQALLNTSEEKENVNRNANYSINRPQDKFGFDDPYVIVGVLDAVSIMWFAGQKDLKMPQNKVLYKQLLSKFSVYIPVLLECFKDTQVALATFFLCGFLPVSYIPHFPDICLSRLQSLPQDIYYRQCKTLLICLCNHGRSESVLLLIKNWVECGLDQVVSNPPKKRKRDDHVSSLVVSIEPKPKLAIMFFEQLLFSPICRNTIFKNDTYTLKGMLIELIRLKVLIEKCKTELIEDEKISFMSRMFSVYLKVIILLHLEKVLNADEDIRELLQWAKKYLIVPSQGIDNGENETTVRNISGCAVDTYTNSTLWVVLCKDLIYISGDIIQVVFVEVEFSAYIDFGLYVLNSEYGFLFVVEVAQLICRILRTCKYLGTKEELQKKTLKLIAGAFHNILRILRKGDTYNKLSTMERNELRMTMKAILISQKKNFPQSIGAMIASLFQNTLEEVLPVISNLVTEPPALLVMPVRSFALISFISGRVELFPLFVKHICNVAVHQDLPDCLASFVIMCRAVKANKRVRESCISDIESSISTFDSIFLSLNNDNNVLLQYASTEMNSLKTCLAILSNDPAEEGGVEEEEEEEDDDDDSSNDSDDDREEIEE